VFEMVSRVLVLGATGRTGQLIVQAALQRSLSVVALVRDPAKLSGLQSPRLSVVQGSPTSAADLKAAIAGCDGVMSALSIIRTTDMPWGAPVGSVSLMSDSMRALVPVMQEAGVRRLVVLSSWGVADDRPNTPWFFRAVLRWTYLAPVFADHDAQDAVVRGSGLDWTLVRAVGFTNSDDPSKTVVSHADSTSLPGMAWISRRLVAEGMLNCLSDDAPIHRSPVIRQS
jgi:uncharacterized protein YbjT (DUF2867 family)